MLQNDSSTIRLDGSHKGGSPGSGRGWLAWILIAGLVPLLFVVSKNKETLPVLSRARLVELLDEERIVWGVIQYNMQSSALSEITGAYVETNANGGQDEKRFRVITRLNHTLEERLLNSGRFEAQEANTLLVSLLYTLSPILLVAGLVYFFFIRQIKIAGRIAIDASDSRSFSTLDRVLIESASQISKPPEPLFVRMHFTDSQRTEGEILWVDPHFIKYRNSTERLEFVIPKSGVLKFERITG